ncbi:MAG: hypothetical protein ACYSSI_08065 [Planctomycetota bacterium]|jgi:hypothetical protein
MNHSVKKLLAVIIFVISSISFVNAEVLPKTDSLLPSETIILFEIPDCNQFQQQLKKTSLYKIYKEPAMADLFKDIGEKLKKELQKEQNVILKNIFDENIFPQGRLAFALVLNEQTINAEKPPFLFLTQWGQHTGRIKELIEKEIEKEIEKGSHRKFADYQNIKITTLIKELPSYKVPDYSYQPDPNTKKPPPMKTIQPPPTKISLCFIDDCLLVSMDLDILKFTIAKIKGSSSPALAADPDYSNTMAAVGPYHDINFYLNIKQLIKTVITKDTSSNKNVQTWLANIGVDNVTSLGCAIGIARENNSSYNGKVLLKINGSKKGICKMLELKPSVIKAPGFLPTNIYTITFFNLDIKNIYTELYKILNRFSPAYAAAMDVPLLPQTPQGQPAIHLKKDIIDHLGSEIILTQGLKKPFPKKSMPIEYLLALNVENSSALEKSMSRFHRERLAINKPNASRELLGHTIYTLEFKMPFLPTGMTPLQTFDTQNPTSSKAPKLAFTITNSHFIFGLESTVEKTIRTLNSGPAASLVSSEWFNKIKATIPSTGFASLKNDTAAFELLWWMIKSAAENSKSPYQFNMMSKSEGFLFEFKDIGSDE